MKLADVFVFYDDVQFTSNTSKSFFPRVQLKTATGRKWLTVPVQKTGKFGQKINEVEIVQDNKWQASHRGQILEALKKAPHLADIMPMVDEVTTQPWNSLADLTMQTTMQIAKLLGITCKTYFASELGIGGSSSERVLNICKHLGATKYLTAHGALNYLEHELFDAAGIQVEYVEYDLSPYPQLHGEFNTYVTVLDLIANTGSDAPHHVQASTTPWQDMVAAESKS